MLSVAAVIALIGIAGCKNSGNAPQGSSDVKAVSDAGKTTSEQVTDFANFDFGACPKHLIDAKALLATTKNRSTFMLSVADIVCLMPYYRVDESKFEPEDFEGKLTKTDLKNFEAVIFNMAKSVRATPAEPFAVKDGLYQRIDGSGCAVVKIDTQKNQSLFRVDVTCQDSGQKWAFSTCKPGVCESGADRLAAFEGEKLVLTTGGTESKYTFFGADAAAVCPQGAKLVGSTCYFLGSNSCANVCQTNGLKYSQATCSTPVADCKALASLFGYQSSGVSAGNFCYIYQGQAYTQQLNDCSNWGNSSYTVACVCQKP